MCIEYCIVLRDKGWMIEREGQLYGPYSSKQEAVREAVYVADYSTRHGLQAEVIMPKFAHGARIGLIPALRSIIEPDVSQTA